MAKERRRGAGAVCSLRAVFPDTPLTLSRLSYAGVISRRALVVLEESLPDALVMGRAHCVRDGLAISWERWGRAALCRRGAWGCSWGWAGWDGRFMAVHINILSWDLCSKIYLWNRQTP